MKLFRMRFFSSGQRPILLVLLQHKRASTLNQTSERNAPLQNATRSLTAGRWHLRFIRQYFKKIRSFIQTSPGFWEPRLRNDSRPSYPHSALLWFLPAGIFCFPELDVFFILEGSLFLSLREYK